jgi:uncharacterized protein YjbJ (UPF0337 family)
LAYQNGASVLQALAQHDIVTSKRGPRGGYQLAREERRSTGARRSAPSAVIQEEHSGPNGVFKHYRDAECVMDWNRIEGNWKQFKGKAKEKWGRLTNDDLDVINGRQDQLEGRIQERYGLAKDQAKKDVETWFRSLP